MSVSLEVRFCISRKGGDRERWVGLSIGFQKKAWPCLDLGAESHGWHWIGLKSHLLSTTEITFGSVQFQAQQSEIRVHLRALQLYRLGDRVETVGARFQ